MNSNDCKNVIFLNYLSFINTMDLSQFETSDGVYYNDEMIECWNGHQHNLVCQFVSENTGYEEFEF